MTRDPMTRRGAPRAAAAGTGRDGPNSGPEAESSRSRLDLRLAGLAVGCWMASLWALYVSAATAFAAGAGAAVVLVGTWWVATRRPAALTWQKQVAGVGLTILLGVVGGTVSTAARTVHRDAPPIADLAKERASVRVDLVVTDDPRSARSPANRPQSWVVPAALRRVDAGGWMRVDVRVLVLATDAGWRHLLPGQHVRTAGTLAPARAGDLRAAVLAVRAPPQRLGRPPWLQRAAGELRTGLQRACAGLPDEPGGLLPGLTVGDTSALVPAVADDFRATGMTHLVAVSGANLAIVTGFVLFLARWCRAGPTTAAVVAGLALAGFVILARPSPSVLRAAVMAAVALVGLAASRPKAALPALATAVFVLVVADPALASDVGFALSVLATTGLLLFAPRWRDALRDRGVPGGLAEAVAVPAAAQLACTPVLVAMTGMVSVVAVPANLLAAVAVPPATLLGVTAAVVSPLSAGVAEFAAWLGSWPAWWLVLVARYGAVAPAGHLPWPGGVTGGLASAVVTVAVLVACRYRPARRLIVVAVLAAAVTVMPIRFAVGGWPPPGWVLVACAVGQGDALVLPSGAGTAVVVDAGPEPAPVDRCLRRLGIHTVALLIVSHHHADHVGGVAGVGRDRRILAVAAPDHPEPAAGWRAVERTAAAHRAQLTRPAAGWTYTVGALRLAVIAPVGVVAGTRSDPNNHSLVVRVSVAGVTLLLPGDAEQEEQAALLQSGQSLRADVLKVPHHGSAFQDPQFLAAVDPAVAVVSVGAENDYGHPNRPLLRALRRDGARLARTDTDGDIAVVRTANGLAVATRGPDPPGVS